MKTTSRRHRTLHFVLFLALSVAFLTMLPGGQPTQASSLLGRLDQPRVAVGTSFTYQGQLKSGGNPANGQYDFIFTLYDALSGGNQVGAPANLTNQMVSQGLFTVQLDFGANAFGGSARWLEIAVRQTGGGTYTTLAPRQPLTAVPYAMSLATSSGSGAAISGTVPGPALIVTNTLNGAIGIQGTSTTGIGSGVYGLAPAGNAILGVSTSGIGVHGQSASSYGVYGYSGGVDGVYGESTGGGSGVHGVINAGNTSSKGVYGESSAGYGVFGQSSTYIGVHGESTSNIGVHGSSVSGNGVGGYSSGGNGGYFTSASSTGIGVGGVNTSNNGWATSGINDTNSTYARGVVAGSDYGYAVYGRSNYGFAGWFDGNVNVTGTCCAAAAGSFKIDDPLDPANKYLVQSAVQSADMMSIYNGNITTNANGEAVVALPDYVEALNTDFRYQLTPIGQFAQAIVASEINGNSFIIKTDKPNVKVSWQITGVRKDRYAQAHPIQAEVAKPAGEQGLYLHPELYGQPDSKGIGYDDRQRLQDEWTKGQDQKR